MDKYLEKAFELLGGYLPFEREVLLDYYKEDGHLHFEEGKYHYLLFSFPELDGEYHKYGPFINKKASMECIIILVFDDDLRVIGDLAALHCSLNDYLKKPEVLDYLCEESDWSYLSHCTLNAFYFDEYPYPISEHDINDEFEGEVLAITNAYVTRSYRKQSIFSNMMEMLEDYIGGNVVVYQVISLDPDVACYGPDSKKEPYIYNFEVDEPVRLLNSEIIKKLGFIPLKLEDSEPGENDDGTKLWFAVKKTTVYDV